MTTTVVNGVCNLCEAICGIKVTLAQTSSGPVVERIAGNPDDPLSRGYICPKATALPDIATDPDRLTRPVKRTDSGFVEIGWDEAIELAVDGLAKVSKEHGRAAVAAYLGNPTVHSLGAQTHLPAVLKALKTPNTFSATSVDQLPHQYVARQLFGHQLLLPIPDLDRTDLFVVFGANPMASNGSLMTAPDFPQRMRDLRARGGRLVVFDPRRTETAAIADDYHPVRPGEDIWILLALLHTIFDEGLAQAPTYVDRLDLVQEFVQAFSPEAVSARCGTPAEAIRELAREIATKRAAVYSRMGVSTNLHGTAAVWAVNCLNIVAGCLDREGGVMFTSPAIDIVGKGLVGSGGSHRWRSRVSGLPEIGGELPVSVLTEEISTPGKGQVRALFTNSGNPVLSTPDGERLSQALGTLDFMVSVDFYINETTRHADVILPPTSALERDQYDLAFHALALRNTARFTKPVLPATPGSRPDWQIYRDLALGLHRALGGRESWQAWAARQARLRTSPRRLVDLLLRQGPGKLSVRRLVASPGGVDLGPLQPQLPQRLRTPDRRITLWPDALTETLTALHQTFGEETEPGSHLALIGRRHKQDCNSWLHNTQRLTKGRDRHHLLMHPNDARSRGITDGDDVEVTSRVGRVVTQARITDDIMQGVVSLPHGYGHGAPDTRLGVANAVTGVNLNALTDPQRLDVSGNAALNGVPVQVRRT